MWLTCEENEIEITFIFTLRHVLLPQQAILSNPDQVSKVINTQRLKTVIELKIKPSLGDLLD